MSVAERRFAAAPAAVYAALVDAEQYPRWLVGARHVSIRDSAWPAAGASFDHEVGAGPIEVDDSTTVREVEPNRRLCLLVRARPWLQADVDFDLVPDGTGTRLRMEERPRGSYRLIGPLIGPLVKARNARSLSNLARLVDGGR